MARLDEDRGIRGTGLDEDRGIGGTGLEPEDRGVGGTGLYGSITGFGSVCVNGIRVHTESGPAVDINGRPAAADDLALGQVVWIEARAVGPRRRRFPRPWLPSTGSPRLPGPPP